MPATSSELTYARSYIGTVEEDAVFNERIDRLDSEQNFDERKDLIHAAIEESLRAQLASLMLDQPGNASVGSVSYSNSTNIQELSKELKTVRMKFNAVSARLVRQRKR